MCLVSVQAASTTPRSSTAPVFHVCLLIPHIYILLLLEQLKIISKCILEINVTQFRSWLLCRQVVEPQDAFLAFFFAVASILMRLTLLSHSPSC